MITREEQLSFCKKCTNRHMDVQSGLICSLTGQKAAFESTCSDYSHDETVKAVVDAVNPIEPTLLKSRLQEELFEKLRLEQNYSVALITGIIASLGGAILWAIISVVTGYQIGFLAIALGALVGLSMRHTGKGLDQVFGITGAFLAVAGCFLGNFFAAMGFYAQAEDMNVLMVILSFDYAYFFEVMTDIFSPMDLFFYAIAGYEGYKFAFRQFTEADIEALR
jgi:hypothetical protein